MCLVTAAVQRGNCQVSRLHCTMGSHATSEGKGQHYLLGTSTWWYTPFIAQRRLKQTKYSSQYLLMMVLYYNTEAIHVYSIIIYKQSMCTHAVYSIIASTNSKCAACSLSVYMLSTMPIDLVFMACTAMHSSLWLWRSWSQSSDTVAIEWAASDLVSNYKTLLT